MLPFDLFFVDIKTNLHSAVIRAATLFCLGKIRQNLIRQFNNFPEQLFQVSGSGFFPSSVKSWEGQAVGGGGE